MAINHSGANPNQLLMKRILYTDKLKGGLKPLIFICIILFLFLSPGFSQDVTMETTIKTAFDQYRSRYIQERIFVHTDKNTYISREILWFRIHDMDAFNQLHGKVSKIAYIEILDKKNFPVLQQKVSLKPGESSGSIIIPVNIPSGTYKFRAYTNWMKNLGPEYFFEKPIRIINPRVLQTDTVISIKNHRYDIQFFPEGGNLVQQIETKVAFRITDAFGKGQEFEGTLLNSTGDTVLKFHPLHMGLGNFLFTPAAGQAYKAVIRFPHGEQVIKDLPVSYTNGYVMNLSKSAEGSIAIQVHVSPELDKQNVYLFIHGNHSFLPVKKEQLINHAAGFVLKPEDLEDGISQFTLFNITGQSVCERLYFKYPEKKLVISAETNPEYTTRKKIDLNLSATNQSGKQVVADMSMAVYRLDSLQDVDENDIRHYLYLTANLGPVESPSFYFDVNEKYREQDMDNLMLTHGWRRFNWNDMLKQNYLPLEFPPEYNGHIIMGKVISKTGAPVPHAEAYLSVPSTRTQFRQTASDDNGNLKFEMTGFYGSQELIVQTSPKEDSTNHIEITSPFSQKYSAFALPDYPIPPKSSPTLLDLSIHEQVQHVYDGTKLNRFTMQVVDTNPFYVVPDEKYMLDDYVRFLTMEEVLREYVRSVNVARRKDKFQVYNMDNPLRKFFEEPPLILIDGVPFFDANELFQQDPKKIKRLDLINREYVLGDRTFQGVINATTYLGDLNGIQINAHAIVLDYPGIPEAREFFSPEYETETQVKSRMPDYRTLLYWAPEIKSGDLGKKMLSFYTSDLPGQYAAVIQGISENGEPGSKVIFFSVKK